MRERTEETKNFRPEELPEQHRIEELAEHFDRSDAGGDPMSWEEADDAVVERPELEQVSVRLPKGDLELLRRRAARTGVGYTTLIRMILREYLNDPLSR